MSQLDPVDFSRFKKEVVGTYDRAASLYGQVGAKFFTYFGNLLIEKLALTPGSSVLDVATGRGALLFPAAQKVGASGHIIGTDLAPAMLIETRSEVQRRGITNISFALMDGDFPAFADSSFDAITCGSALFFLDFERTLPEFRRLLNPGGTFAAYLSTTATTPSSERDLERWRWLFALTREVFPEGFVAPLAWRAPSRLNKADVLEAALTSAGFEEISITFEEADLTFADENDWWNWEWSQGSRFWVEGMTPEALEKFKTVSFQNLEHMKEADGIHMVWVNMLVTAMSSGDKSSA